MAEHNFRVSFIVYGGATVAHDSKSMAVTQLSG